MRQVLLAVLLAVFPGTAFANEDPFPCNGPAFNKILDRVEEGVTLAKTQAFLDAEAIAYEASEAVSPFERGLGVRYSLRVDAPEARRADSSTCFVETMTIGYDASDRAVWLHCDIGTDRMPCESE